MSASSRVKVCLLCLVSLICLAQPALAGSKGKAAQSQADPKAVEVLAAASAVLAKASCYSFTAQITMDVVFKNGFKLQAARNATYLVKRPDCFRVVSDGDEAITETVYDGKTFTHANMGGKFYFTAAVPGGIDAALAQMAARFGAHVPLADLMRQRPGAMLSGRGVYYVGLGRARGELCHHLYFPGKEADVQLWLSQGETPLPRKIVISEKKMAGLPQVTAYIADFNLAAKAADLDFSFTPPPGFVKIETLAKGRAADKGAKP